MMQEMLTHLNTLLSIGASTFSFFSRNMIASIIFKHTSSLTSPIHTSTHHVVTQLKGKTHRVWRCCLTSGICCTLLHNSGVHTDIHYMTSVCIFVYTNLACWAEHKYRPLLVPSLFIRLGNVLMVTHIEKHLTTHVHTKKKERDIVHVISAVSKC